jgi:hypothetical protein
VKENGNDNPDSKEGGRSKPMKILEDLAQWKAEYEH